jgi:hypothetical protein
MGIYFVVYACLKRWRKLARNRLRPRPVKTGKQLMTLRRLPYSPMMVTTCMAMGVMVSPLSMPVIGNSAGALGKGLLWILPLVALLNALTVSRGHARFVAPAATSLENQKPAGFRTIVSVLHFSALLPFCVGAGTLILAAAGYTFNEVFVRWFPNLLFSGCFLVFIGVVNFAGKTISGYMQNIALLLVVGSILLLVAIGLFTLDRPLLGDGGTTSATTFEPRSLFMLFWLFMAAELALDHNHRNGVQFSERYALVAAFGAALVVYWLWAIISMASTPHATLSQSTGPHTFTAHLLAGATGRTIMGVAVLAGTFAALNTLMRGAGEALRAALAPLQRQWPFAERLTQEKAALLFITILIAGMLLTGMAGKEETFTFKRSAFYIWLMAYAGMNTCALLDRPKSSTSGKTAVMAGIGGIMAVVIYITAVVVLVATDPDITAVIAFMIGFIGFSGLVALAGRHLAGGSRKTWDNAAGF